MMLLLIGLLLKSLAVAAVTLLALRLTRSRSAAERSLIAHLGLLALVALPVATLLLPSLNVPLPEAMRSQVLPATPLAAQIADAPSSVTPETKVAAEPISSPTITAQVAPTLRALAPYAYALPALALLLLTIAALAHLARLRARAEVLVDPVWLSALAHAQRRMGHKSGTALLVSDTLPSPISWGLARPTILLSADALAASGEAEAIIAHELAHVAAFDWVKLMLARVATAIHWFNPLAWRLAREAHQLREEAADDMVLGAEIAAPDYAQLLVRVARHESKGLLLGAHGVAPGRGSLKRRVGRVLDTALPRTPARGSWMAGFGAGMLVMAAPLAALSVGAVQQVDAHSTRGLAVTTVTDHGPAPAHVAATPVAPHAAALPAEPAEIAAAAPVAAAVAAAMQDRHDKSNRHDQTVDAIIGAKATGVTPDYVASIRRAAPQLGSISLDDATAMRAMGVTPEYVGALASSGMRNVTVENVIAARSLGISPAYIRSMASAGFRGSLDDYVSLAAVGVTMEDVKNYRRAGIPLDADDMTARKAMGGNPRPHPHPDPDD
ncbi:M56 family metallopeptidase [Sphingomonas sp. R-74633]|uniref:M56 family metallopeptidase n=1 Tax=Sphingomonas sp. R-74633 TaxID=2751188 RepID=UPI0015D107A7|nr:M56 family metallopeptidase [Sphingomonas sp. R-74633]NYT39713.1 M56 family metallopeptidase [Sphingomonas sp. R-74633]